MGETSLEDLSIEMENEITKLQTELISEKEYQKLQNQFENNFVNSNSGVENIAGTLATNYMLKGNTKLINDEINIYRSITREDIKRVANELLNANSRVEMDYLKAKSE